MRFIETLLIKKEIINLHYHNKRFNETRKKFFNAKEMDLKDYVKLIPFKRVRITYSEEILNIEYFELKKREFKKFKIVRCDDIEYSYKYADRKKLDELKQPGFDEIIIIKNSLITDTTISNLAFYDSGKWYTPKKPLLKGTKREELISKGKLIETDIGIQDLKKFKKFAMINAILGFYEVKIENIYL